MSRTIFGIALALGLALAAGCGPKSEPTLPKVAIESQPTSVEPIPPGPAPTLNPNAGVPSVEPPKGPTWELDQTKHVIPETPVRGTVDGIEVTPSAMIEGDELTFRAKSGTPEIECGVRLKLAPMLIVGQPLPQVVGRSWAVKLDADAGAAVPVVWREISGKAPYLAPAGYALTLELGPRDKGKVTGKIYLCLMDERKTTLAGTFTAEYKRRFTERPGGDDVPYIAGDVTVIGAKPDAEVRVAYVAFTPTRIDFKELQLGCTPEVEWLPDPDKSIRPRASLLVSGDGKSRPFRYEHVKLTPGRYLVSVAVVGGPAAWKWVDVPPKGELTENFVLDATKTGGVEVSTAIGVKGKVLIGPADEPGKLALEPSLFEAVAFQVVRQDIDIVAGKATIKNLAPGKYEVRVEDERRVVEIIAGKVAELDMTPPKK